MAKRGENIYKRKDGRWEARYPKCYVGGRVVYGYVYGPTYGEAKAKRVQLMADIKTSSLSTDRKSNSEKVMRDLANEWLNE